MESSFQTAICNCPDITASTMALDASGRFALMSSRKAMVLVDLEGDKKEFEISSMPSASINLDDKSDNAQQRPSALTRSTKVSPVSRRMVRNCKYEPTASHFSRLMTDLYALTSYQVVEVYSMENLNPMKPKLVLRGHSRAIADVEWSHFDPYLVGSAGADCLTNLWDIRDARRPFGTLTSVSSATQVRFSKTSPNLVASCHEIDLRVWDIRQPNLPLYYIAAHIQKINGIDWNPNKTICDQDQLITCSQDNTIKIWDLSGNKMKPSASFPTRAPAWRIRYTPVSSSAILTNSFPQLRSRTECLALKLWSMKPHRFEQRKLELILGLVGHSDVIIDFDWRARMSDTSDCEIVSWSKDQTLRVWRIDRQFIEMNVENSDYEIECGAHQDTATYADSMEASSLSIEKTSYQPQSRITPLGNEDGENCLLDVKSEVGGKLASLPTIETAGVPGYHEPSRAIQAQDNQDEDEDYLTGEDGASNNELRQEFNLINRNIPNVEFEELNSLRRVCLVTARAKNVFCRLRIALPPSYPHQDCPTFTLISPTGGSNSQRLGPESLSKEARDKLLELLNETARAQLARSRNCIEPCVRKFVAALQKIAGHQSHRQRRSMVGQGASDLRDDPIRLSAQRDHSVPFPPTAGARFCGNLLVIFGRPIIPTSASSSSTVTVPGISVGSAGMSGTQASETATNLLVETPRSMAQLSAQLDNMRRQGSYNLNHISISYFYYGAMRRAELQSRQNQTESNSASGHRSKLGLAQGAAPSVGQSHTSAGIGSSRAGAGRYLAIRSRSSALHTIQSMSKSYKCGPVIVYDVADLFGGISRELAEQYVFDKDVIKMCRRNTQVAASLNRRDLVQVWSLAKLSSEGVLHSHIPNSSAGRPDPADGLTGNSSDFGDRPWTMHPFGSKLIQSLIDHYVNNCHDVQTAAMLVWTFSSPRLGQSTAQRVATSADRHSDIADCDHSLQKSQYNRLEFVLGAPNQPQRSPLHSNVITSDMIKTGQKVDSDSRTSIAIITADTISDDWNFVSAPETHLYSNSWSNSTLHMSPNEIASHSRDATTKSIATSDELYPKLNILDPQRGLQNDLIMHIYAELLYRLNLLNQRAMVLKNIGTNSPYSEIFGAQVHQQTHGRTPSSPQGLVEDRLPNINIQCHNCQETCHSFQCNSCKKYSLYCSICRLPVKGSCSVCMKCQHGGHFNHFSTWFDSYEFCPAGCGCKCLLTEF